MYVARDYKQRFDLLEYENVTGLMIFYKYFKNVDITICHVKHFAGDRGYTVDYLEDLKRTKNGVYTITDVTFEEFGEGSFDSVYISVPISMFNSNESSM